MEEGTGPLSFPKNIIFSQTDKSGCILTQFLAHRKDGQSLEALEHGLYCLIA